ncbi:neurogenic locus notch homolog protein 1-like isoform X2 [Stegodyphus dumicola]|uniref:neurogenic locus notch homolog protein 1-like isoform X2 n=1 Tax=Stegodyphus dumicola TaxID=202533 RepID=UPI0015AA9BC9|nr:neurogenic locus notch homolog protein 1-like isoform X2 [Stegodyphus dumicola]
MKYFVSITLLLISAKSTAAFAGSFTSECDSEHRCENGGTCTGKGSIKYCVCPPLVYGSRCNVVLYCEAETLCAGVKDARCVYNIERESAECQCTDPNRIYKDGKCVDCTCEKGNCVKDKNGRSFCQCPPEYGLYDVATCKECNCGKGAACTFQPVLFRGISKTCICKEGYKDVEGTCTDQCTTNPCRNGGTCVNSYECKCPSGYVGPKCERRKGCECEDGKCVNEVCTCPKGFGLRHNTKCLKCNCGEDNGCKFSAFWGIKTCHCKEGYKEIQGVCVDSCLVSPCQNGGTCENSYTCRCSAGYRGLKCEMKDYCSNVGCQHGGTCSNTDETFSCNCQLPHIGKTCQKEICDFNICRNNAACEYREDVNHFNQNGPLDIFIHSFIEKFVKCNCTYPYSGKYCEKPPGTCDSNPCQNNGLCIEKDSDTECMCPPPFAGKNCEIDVCSLNPCKNGGTCRFNGWESLKNWEKVVTFCECKLPFFGEFCELDICSSNPCLNGGSCKVVGNVSKCTCKKPFFGEHCEKDPCTPNPCMNGGNCKITGENSICDCRRPFSGEHCQLDPCMANPCMNRGKCKVVGENFTCDCKKPYFGKYCEQNPCTRNPCMNGGNCEVVGENVKCDCIKPYSGEFCQSDPCKPNLCTNGGSCEISGEAAICICRKPFFGEFCEIDLCTPNPCMNDGRCRVLGEEAVCDCKTPSSGLRCEKDPCTVNPCMNGGDCRAEGQKAKCLCRNDFTGDRCEKKKRDKEKKISSSRQFSEAYCAYS